MKPNRLIKEKSPYLLQHAYNPVDWYPWGSEAIEKSKKENKPIFLSIGYSTCYWCHVMEREVFENKDVAELLNQYFVNIKVDREERPDIDRVYMTALYALTGSGGWPMSMFLTPQLKPFFGGTYFPPDTFIEVIKKINELWENSSTSLLDFSQKVMEFSADIFNRKEPVDYVNLFSNANSYIMGFYDSKNGGFMSQPKFPNPQVLSYLLDTSYESEVYFTLEKMYKGAVYDHIDGGFHRYSVTEDWSLPHFEKMLYDQALLLSIYSRAYSRRGSDIYLHVINGIFEFLKNWLYSGSAFYTAVDAESLVDGKKIEGGYYLFEEHELNSTGSDALEVLDPVKISKNYDPHGTMTGKYIVRGTNAQTPAFLEYTAKLKKIRESREKPFIDKKIITSINSLMVSALLEAYHSTQNEEFFLYAAGVADFLVNNLYRDGLYHYYMDGAEGDGMLEDYAFFVNALIDLYETTFDKNYIEFALKLNDEMINKFYDPSGGFFDSNFFVKTKDVSDAVYPSANSIAIKNNHKISILTGDINYEKIVNDTLQSLMPGINHFNSCGMLDAYKFVKDFNIFVVSGSKKEAIKFVKKIYLRPRRIILHADDFEKFSIYRNEKPVLNVCDTNSCRYKIENILEVDRILNG